MHAAFSPGGPRVLAHRGLALDAVENTLEAFQAAVDVGARHLESDVHVTADGVPVLWHDPDLRRFDGSELRLRDLSWSALRTRESGGARICTLAEALDACRDATFNLDLKVAAAAGPAATAIRRAGAVDRVLLTSFIESRVAPAWRELPGVAKSAPRERLLRALLAIELGDERGLARAFGGMDAVQMPERAIGLTLTHPKRLPAFKRHVREVHVWTVNEPADMRRLLDTGVDGIVTDRADLALPLVAAS